MSFFLRNVLPPLNKRKNLCKNLTHLVSEIFLNILFLGHLVFRTFRINFFLEIKNKIFKNSETKCPEDQMSQEPKILLKKNFNKKLNKLICFYKFDKQILLN